jgi:hypothetical protein
MFAKNEGARDRLVSTMLGGGLLAVLATSIWAAAGGPAGIVAAVAGAILLSSAAAGSRLVRRPLYIETSKERHGRIE